jgi:hypothetical protein
MSYSTPLAHTKRPSGADTIGCMRRAWFSLLLTVCLLLAQLGGVRHEFVHLSHAAGAGGGSQPDVDEGPCLSCLGHADLQFAVHTDAFQVSGPVAEGETPFAVRVAFTPASAVQARSRGPPTSL